MSTGAILSQTNLDFQNGGILLRHPSLYILKFQLFQKNKQAAKWPYISPYIPPHTSPIYPPRGSQNIPHSYPLEGISHDPLHHNLVQRYAWVYMQLSPPDLEIEDCRIKDWGWDISESPPDKVFLKFV